MKSHDYKRDTGLRRKNIRLALILAGFALLVLVTSFPFWQNIFKVLGDVAK